MLFEHASATEQVLFQGGVSCLDILRKQTMSPSSAPYPILDNTKANTGFTYSKNKAYKHSSTVTKHGDKQASFCWCQAQVFLAHHAFSLSSQ